MEQMDTPVNQQEGGVGSSYNSGPLSNIFPRNMRQISVQQRFHMLIDTKHGAAGVGCLHTVCSLLIDSLIHSMPYCVAWPSGWYLLAWCIGVCTLGELTEQCEPEG